MSMSSRSVSGLAAPAGDGGVLARADAHQARLMRERVVLVTPDDAVVGPLSKVSAHLLSTGLPLHRAFSVFLFDSRNRMLLQQRAHSKVTFPGYWANACCSHPLFTPEELGVPNRTYDAALDAGSPVSPAAPVAAGAAGAVATADATVTAALRDGVVDPVLGAKRAALRKLTHELGVRPGDIKLADLHYLHRIHYRAEAGDGVWGEHELDYLLFCRVDVPLSVEENEVHQVSYMTQAEVRDLFQESESGNKEKAPKVAPWFRYIVDEFGWTWWNQLCEAGPDGVVAVSEPPNAPVFRFGDVANYNWRFHATKEYPA